MPNPEVSSLIRVGVCLFPLLLDQRELCRFRLDLTVKKPYINKLARFVSLELFFHSPKQPQIVELENQVRELTKECELKEQQLQKINEELRTYKDFLEVRFSF